MVLCCAGGYSGASSTNVSAHRDTARGAGLFEAPAIVDCSNFLKWLDAQRSIWLPRQSIQQRAPGKAISLHEIAAGDVVFLSDRIDYYHNDPKGGAGHVGIATGDGTIVHAANRTVNIVETPLTKFVNHTRFRGARRYITRDIEVLTFETPLHREIEVADDKHGLFYNYCYKGMKQNINILEIGLHRPLSGTRANK